MHGANMKICLDLYLQTYVHCTMKLLPARNNLEPQSRRYIFPYVTVCR